MDVPEMKYSIIKCEKCNGEDNVSLTMYDGAFEIPRITWCSCGHINVKIGMGMDVNVERS